MKIQCKKCGATYSAIRIKTMRRIFTATCIPIVRKSNICKPCYRARKELNGGEFKYRMWEKYT